MAAVGGLGLVTMAILGADPVSAASQPTSGTIYFTCYANQGSSGSNCTGGNDVQKATYSYTGTSLTVGSPVGVANTQGADGLQFLPNGDLVVAGQQSGTVSEITPGGTLVKQVSAGVPEADHISVSPAGLYGANPIITVGGYEGHGMAVLPVGSDGTISAGTSCALSLSGTLLTPAEEQSFVLDSVVWVGSQAYFTESSPSNLFGGYGTFGAIDITYTGGSCSANLIPLLPALPSAHGMAYDPYSNSILTFGSQMIAQIKVGGAAAPSASIVSEITFGGQACYETPSCYQYAGPVGSSSNNMFDQGAVDGTGHIFVSNNNGNMVFVDYSQIASGLIAGTSTNRPFVSDQFETTAMDDVAPLLGPGGPLEVNTVPSPTTATPGQRLSDSVSIINPRTVWPSGDAPGYPYVQFKLYGPNDGSCSAGTAILRSPQIAYTGASSTVTWTPPAWNSSWDGTPGTYNWVVNYYYWDVATQTMAWVYGTCGAEPVIVSRTQPALSTHLSASSAFSPAGVTDQATLSGANAGATGTITIRAYSGNSSSACTDAVPVATELATPVTNGDGTYSASFTGLTAGSYEFQATYAGDTTDGPTRSVCGTEPLTVTSPTVPSIITQLSAGSAISPATVTDTATLGGASHGATGAITIRAYSGNTSAACTATNLVGTETAAPVTDGNGSYKATFTGLTAGDYEFQATYAGDTANTSAQSACGSEPLTVVTTPPPGPPTTPNTPSITTVPSAGGPVGTVLSDTAQVTGIVNPAASDSVSFGLYSDPTCSTLVDNLGTASVMGPVTTNGVATWTASSPSTGYAPAVATTYYWGVTFNSVGDPANLSSSMVCGEPVTITLASGTLGAHTPPGSVKAASTPTPNTGADLFMPGLLAAIAVLLGGVLLLTGFRVGRNPGL